MDGKEFINDTPIGHIIRNVLYRYGSMMCRAGDRVLKTDLWNEAKNEEPLILPGHLFRIEISYLRTLKAHVANGVCGSIRALPYKDGVFDVVLDISTIDHTTSFERILIEYWRVLKPGGKLLVASWLGSRTSYILSETANDQWVHCKTDFEKVLEGLFPSVIPMGIVDPELAKTIWHIPGADDLVIDMCAYVCAKEA